MTLLMVAGVAGVVAAAALASSALGRARPNGEHRSIEDYRQAVGRLRDRQDGRHDETGPSPRRGRAVHRRR